MASTDCHARSIRVSAALAEGEMAAALLLRVSVATETRFQNRQTIVEFRRVQREAHRPARRAHGGSAARDRGGAAARVRGRRAARLFRAAAESEDQGGEGRPEAVD